MLYTSEDEKENNNKKRYLLVIGAVKCSGRPVVDCRLVQKLSKTRKR